ncbi:hypothetical protein Syun_003561 [Stephania yunnanensis]|uniref:Trichome birefringence-like N-terminal domain-containing protein n=1 Tax=Stephania yunnanensis TaxID=152371 RepID=A0AAP0L5B9_9MAGN
MGFNCLANGRKDHDYLKWRWKPKNCELPKFDVLRILKWLRGKRVVFVGDSMSRTQWESMICMLMTGVEDKRGVYEINGNKITKQIKFLSVYFTSYNFTVEFFRSVFLVQQGWASRHGPKRVKSTLKLDKLDDISKEWSDSDILIFNSGHWWSPGKLFDAGCYFQVGGALKLGMPITTAFRTALNTWASWVETRVNTNRTRHFGVMLTWAHGVTCHLCQTAVTGAFLEYRMSGTRLYSRTYLQMTDFIHNPLPDRSSYRKLVRTVMAIAFTVKSEASWKRSLSAYRNRIQCSLLDEAALDPTGLFASRLRVVFGNDRD